MNKKWYILLSILLIIGIGFGIYYYLSKNNIANINYETNRISTTTKNNNDNNDNSNNKENNIENTNTTNNSNQEINKKPTFIEEELSKFSTKILSNDKSRQNNIEITCKALNNKTIKKGDTFSFCNTIGPSTIGKGYQKADIFDNDGNKKKGLGGGNCQVSSTLYNAVLNCDKLKITERHEHSNYVPYVKKGKDAAVAYGSYDFKFINNYDFDIKINCSTNGKTVDIIILAIKPI